MSTKFTITNSIFAIIQKYKIRLVMSLCFLSLEINKIFNRLILKEIEKNGFEDLSESLIVLFPYIDANTNITATKLSKKLGYSRQAMHKNIKKLENLGYITLSFENQKAKNISLSQKGFKIVKIANDFIAKTETNLEKLLGKTKLQEYIKIQNQIYEYLQDK